MARLMQTVPLASFDIMLVPPTRWPLDSLPWFAALLVAASVPGCRSTQPSVLAGANVDRGRQAIETIGCGACHVVGGIPGAVGEVGPPLSGVARRAIIGGVLPNTPNNMVAWIEDPPSFAPNTAMPNLGVTTATARDIVAYLYTLR
jgi:cytochrome c2